jgi:hypothetical protein
VKASGEKVSPIPERAPPPFGKEISEVFDSECDATPQNLSGPSTQCRGRERKTGELRQHEDLIIYIAVIAVRPDRLSGTSIKKKDEVPYG